MSRCGNRMWPKATRSSSVGRDEPGAMYGPVLGALAGSGLLPLLQAISTKAEEDLYEAIRERVARSHRRRSNGVLQALPADDSIVLADPVTRVAVRLPAHRTPSPGTIEKAPRPAASGTKGSGGRWWLITWDADSAPGVAQNVDRRPPGALTATANAA